MDAGTELEVAPPVAAPQAASDAISRGKRNKPSDLGAEGTTGDEVSGGPSETLVIAGVDEAAESSESSASHLGGQFGGGYSNGGCEVS